MKTLFAFFFAAFYLAGSYIIFVSIRIGSGPHFTHDPYTFGAFFTGASVGMFAVVLFNQNRRSSSDDQPGDDQPGAAASPVLPPRGPGPDSRSKEY